MFLFSFKWNQIMLTKVVEILDEFSRSLLIRMNRKLKIIYIF